MHPVMLQILTASCVATFTYACAYALCGFLESRFVHHYIALAANPSLGGRRQTTVRISLCAGLVGALVFWVHTQASAAHALVTAQPWYLSLAIALTFFVLTCAIVLVVVWVCFRLGCEFTLISPEMLVAIAMLSYTVAILLYQIDFPRRFH